MTKTSAVLVGEAIGDALGLPFESLEDDIHPGLVTWDGTYQPCKRLQLPPGHFSDDTEMAECLARSLIECNRFDGEDVARRYLAWSQGTPHGMGGTTRTAMKALATGVDWRSSGVPFADPNEVGSAPPMRAAPIGAFFSDEEAIARACEQDAYITHADVEAVAASFAVAFTVHLALRYVEPASILANVLDGLARQLFQRTVGGIVYVRGIPARKDPVTRVEKALVDVRRTLALGLAAPELFTVECAGRRGNAWQITTTAIYCALHANSFRDGVIAAVKLGGDADTRGAIAGAILGARFGLEGIPDEYKTGLLQFDSLLQLDQKLARKAL
jgi:ADP-ribosyl-[dinitrogen reductase] hydrolase